MPKPIVVSNPLASPHLIVVMGVAGSGKSTLAARLASDYGYHFLEGDDFHSTEARQLMAAGTPLNDAQRAPWIERIFQRLHRAKQQNEHCVLAFSGLRSAHRQIIRSAGLKTLVLFLEGDKDTVSARVNNRANHFMNPSLVQSQFEALESPIAEPDVIAISLADNPEHLVAQSKLLVQQHLIDPLHST